MHSLRNWLRRQRLLLLAQVAPQVEVGQEVGAACRRTGRAGRRRPPRRRPGAPAGPGWTAPRRSPGRRAGNRARRPPPDIRASRGSTGSCASVRPIRVSRDVGDSSVAKCRRARAAARRRRRPARRSGGSMKPNAATSPRSQRRHLQDHRRQVGAQDLRVGELRARLEVLLRVQPDADAVGGAPAPSGALGGRGLRDRVRSAAAAPSVRRL